MRGTVQTRPSYCHQSGCLGRSSSLRAYDARSGLPSGESKLADEPSLVCLESHARALALLCDRGCLDVDGRRTRSQRPQGERRDRKREPQHAQASPTNGAERRSGPSQKIFKLDNRGLTRDTLICAC